MNHYGRRLLVATAFGFGVGVVTLIEGMGPGKHPVLSTLVIPAKLMTDFWVEMDLPHDEMGVRVFILAVVVQWTFVGFVSGLLRIWIFPRHFLK